MIIKMTNIPFIAKKIGIIAVLQQTGRQAAELHFNNLQDNTCFYKMHLCENRKNQCGATRRKKVWIKKGNNYDKRTG